MSARLAIGAVAAIAGLAALGRKGSRSVAGYMPPFAGLEWFAEVLAEHNEVLYG